MHGQYLNQVGQDFTAQNDRMSGDRRYQPSGARRCMTAAEAAHSLSSFLLISDAKSLQLHQLPGR